VLTTKGSVSIARRNRMTCENSWQTYNYEDEIKLSYDSKKDGVWVSEGTDKLKEQINFYLSQGIWC
jgi:hypothetical protein